MYARPHCDLRGRDGKSLAIPISSCDFPAENCSSAVRISGDLAMAVPNLDERNRAIVIAEALARVIAAVRIASVR